MNLKCSDFTTFLMLSQDNKELKNEVIKSDKDLRSLIQNFKNRNICHTYDNKKNLPEKDKILIWLSSILEVVSIDYVVSILLGKTMMIMNSNNQEENNATVLWIDLNKYLIKNYFYELYKNEKKNPNLKIKN